MGKLPYFIVILVFIVLALFAFFNQGIVSVNVPFWKSFDLEIEYLVLISSLFGAVVMMLLFAIRDTRRFMVSYKDQRRQKKEEKIQALYSKAVTAILADDASGARTLLDQVLKVEPGHTDALLRLGDLASEDEQYDEAAAFYRRAQTSEPQNLEALFSLASTMVAQRQWDQALGYVEKILDQDQDNLSALYRKRGLSERKGKWEEVLDIQKNILKHEHHPAHLKREQVNQLGFRYEMGRESLERGDFEKANKTFRAILKDEKGFIPAHLGVAEVLLNEGDTEGAVKYLEDAYGATGSQIVLVRLEDMLINLGEPGRLLGTYRKAVGEHPDDEQLKFFLGKLYFRLEMVDDALETLKDLEGQEWPDLHKLLGELYLRRDRCDLAVQQFKKTLEMRSSFRQPYCCSVCGRKEDEWSGRCPDCGHWNTFHLTVHDVCNV